MNFLYIGPEFPPNYKSFPRELAQRGARVLAIGEADFFSLPEDLRRSLAWYVRCRLSNRDEFAHAISALVDGVMGPRQWGKIDVVESHNEHWMALEACANEIVGARGIVTKDLPRLRRKSLMKDVFRSLQLPVARGGLVRTLDECLALAREIGYPLILKPDEGVGAVGVMRADDEGDLRRAWHHVVPPYVLEEFISGQMVTFDGLTDWEGNVIFESSLVYGAGVFENVCGRDTFFHTRREIPPRLAAVGRDVVRAFKIQRKFFHIEFFEAGGRLIPVEVNARPPGGAILDMMNYSVDDDLYRAYAELIVGGPGTRPAIAAEKRHFCAFCGRKERSYIHPHDEVVRTMGAMLVEHGENPALYWTGMGRYRYIFRSPSLANIEEMRDWVLTARGETAAA